MAYSVPHVAPLPPLGEGAEIIVDGTINPNAKRFTISLCKERDISHTAPLAFDVRLEQNVVVRNHNHNGWGTEDRQGGCPFKKGERHEVKIVVKSNEYQIFVDKNHFCNFPHRVGKEEARNLVIDGDLAIHKVVTSGDAHHNPPVPLTIPVQNLHSGRKIIVKGVPTGGARFNVSLLCGPSFDHDDVAFCIDARFKFGSDTNKVIQNHKSGGKWGTEQKSDHFPFSAGNEFELAIKVKEDAFKVTVNDEKLATYHFHIKPDRVTHLHVSGDVKLIHVKA